MTNNRKSYCIKHNYQFGSCSTAEETKLFTCTVVQPAGYKGFTSLIIFKGGESNIRNDVCFLDILSLWMVVVFHLTLPCLKGISCQDDRYGFGREKDTSTIECEEGLEGSSTAVCQAGKWQSVEDTCIVTTIKELLIFSEVSTLCVVPRS